MVPGFSEKKLGYPKYHFSIEMKIKLNQLYILTSALFPSLFDLVTAIEIRQVHKRFINITAIEIRHKHFIKLPITLLFWHDVRYSFWTFNFSKVLARLFRLYFVPC